MFVERLVDEAVGPELAQALVMIYCRHLHHDDAKAAIRAMLAREPGLTAELDGLDRLHRDMPFQDLAHLSLGEELELLYWHQSRSAKTEPVRQLRKLCAHDPLLTAAFDRLDAQGVS